MFLLLTIVAVFSFINRSHQQAYETCSKLYGSYVLVTQTGLQYTTVETVCSDLGAVPASINAVNWSRVLDLYTWCSYGALPSSMAYPWIGGGQTAGSCPIITSVPGNSDVTTASIACDGGQTRAIICQSVPVQTNTQFTVSTTTSTFAFSTTTSTSTTATVVLTSTFTGATVTVTSTLTVSVPGVTTSRVNTSTTVRSTTVETSVDSTVVETTTTSTTGGTTSTRTFTCLQPRTLTQSSSTRTTVTSPTYTQFSCVH